MVYFVQHLDDREQFGMALAPEGAEERFRYALDAPPASARGSRRREWRFELNEGEFADFQPNDLGVYLFSPKLRDTIEQEKGEADSLQWNRVVVACGDHACEYFILIITTRFPEVLDHARTIFANDSVMSPVFSRNGLKGHDVFSLPGDDSGGRLYVTERVRKAIQRGKFTGIDFSREPVA